jgi:hypothetical protein
VDGGCTSKAAGRFVKRSVGKGVARIGTDDKGARVQNEKLDLAQERAQAIASAFSATTFRDLFAGQEFAPAWSQGDALAMWYALGHLALALSAAKVYGARVDLVSHFLVLCEPHMQGYWAISESEVQKFRAAVERTESEALHAYALCESGDDLQRFISRCVDRVLGVQVSLSAENKDAPHMDCLSRGLEPKAGLVLSHGVWILFIGIVRETRQALNDRGDPN